MGIRGPAPEFTCVDIAMDRVMRDAKEAAELLHPIYGYDFKTLPEEKAENLADRLEQCAAFVRLAVEKAKQEREKRRAA